MRLPTVGKDGGVGNNTLDDEEHISLWAPLMSAVHAQFVGAVVVWFTSGTTTCCIEQM